MLKFWQHKYTLHPLTQIGALAEAQERKGALLKIQWPDQKIGYADLFPWTELGDKDLNTQLEGISKGFLSELVEQSIWMARKDAIARSEKRNAFTGAARVKNHFLINDPLRIEDVTISEARGSGFTTFKIKIGRKPDEELKWVERLVKQQNMMVRLDFNSSSTPAEFEKLMTNFNPGLRSKIEFVEDPFRWNEDAWKKANEIVPLAIDQEFDRVNWDKLKSPAPFKVIVIKPARQDVKKTVDRVNKLGVKMVVTSSLDHPVGVAHAVWAANDLKKFYPNQLLECGCLSLRAYKANDFAASMILQGPYLVESPGFGIGFDSIFERLAWIPLGPQK